MNIERQPQESLVDYHKRLVYGKLVDRTLADADYVELSEKLYGQPYSSDVARRMMYGSRKTLELLDSQQIAAVEDSSVLSDIDEKIIELKKERQKFFDQRREYSKIIAAEARYEHIIDELRRSSNSLIHTVGCLYESDNVKHLETYDSEAVLVFSDWHYGLNAKNVFNTFNTDICKSRVMFVTNKAIQKLSLHKCSKLHIVVLGDLIHGAIHTSARVASEELVCDQLMQVSEVLAQTIEKLSMYVPETCVYVTYGNHARTIQNKGDSIHRDNMERLVPWWLSQRLMMHENIHIIEESENEFLLINTCGKNICASHGDNDYVGNASRILPTLFQSKFGVNIDYILLGDKHHRESFEELGITSILCGSLCGTDDYANNKRLYSTPSQILLIFNDEDGLDAEYRLKCT